MKYRGIALVKLVGYEVRVSVGWVNQLEDCSVVPFLARPYGVAFMFIMSVFVEYIFRYFLSDFCIADCYSLSALGGSSSVTWRCGDFVDVGPRLGVIGGCCRGDNVGVD